jgi:flagellar hook assembly protein FlgD
MSFELTAPGPVEIVLFDTSGREVRRFEVESSGLGRRVLEWDGGDASGRQVTPGVYLARVRSAGQERSVKLVRR